MLQVGKGVENGNISETAENHKNGVNDRAQITEICCIGAGYVGGPTMAVISKFCPEINVTVVDINKSRIDAWNSKSLPIYEPGLLEILEQQRNKNLFFTTDVVGSIKKAQIIFIAVNTPTKDFGAWGGCGYDLSAYESASVAIAKYAEQSTIVVEKSTVPVRTAERIRMIFDSNKIRPDIEFEVISNPEFLAEGTAIKDLMKPDRILIGGHSTTSGQRAIRSLSWIYEHWVPQENIITSGLWSAELAKLASNAFLAQRVSSINSMSALCEAAGADVQEVAKVLGTDNRIGDKFLKSSVGFGGSCFGKDLLGLIYLCETYQLHEVAEYWRQVIKINDYQKERFSKLIVEKMFGNLKRKNICILGFAFKKDTGDIRESAAIDIAKFLLAEGANVVVYDPKVPEIEITKISESIKCEKDPYAAALESHAVIILTEWDEFKTLDYEKIYKGMQKPAFLFDGRNILDHYKIRSMGYYVYGIGKPFMGPDYKRLDAQY